MAGKVPTRFPWRFPRRRKTDTNGPSTPQSTKSSDLRDIIGSPPVFRYQPLDNSVGSIRLLIVTHGSEHAPLHCQLTHTNFLANPQYNALSYTWGDPTDTVEILVNECRFECRRNLYDALCHVREQTQGSKITTIWADAICIDQSNMEERKHQVLLMDYIYTRAFSVFLWLGPTPALDEARVSGSGFVRVLLDEKEMDNFWNGSMSLFRSRAAGAERDFTKWICQREYWTRLWVIQEVALARDLFVFVGDVCWTWETFFQELQKCASKHEGASDLQRIEIFDQKRKGRHSDSNMLENLLEDFQYAKCQEKQDKIYGLLGLAHDCEEESSVIEVDYSKPLFQLHNDVVSFFNRKQWFSNGNPKTTDRAMRVVRFSQLVQRLLGSVTYPSDFSSVRSIAAIGSIKARIIHLGPTYHAIVSSGLASKQWRSSFQRYHRLPDSIRRLREANERYMQVVWNMLPIEASKFRKTDPFTERSKATLVSASCWNDDPSDWTEASQNSKIDDFTTNDSLPPETSNLIGNCDAEVEEPSGQRMFLATDSLFGLAPQSAREGDFVCHFWKTDVTALARQVNDTNVFHVVGRLHLHLRRSSSSWNEPPPGADAMIVHMDIKTLSMLTC